MKITKTLLALFILALVTPSCVVAIGNDDLKNGKTQKQIEEIVNNAEMQQCCKDAALLGRDCDSCKR
ncbi:MAG: hypothetical protein HOM34_01015 [Planctomycetes bacterium]|jgi:hypothetical protein|nr:hypothetical protein [Planctomycetota bacterium]MBT4029313.1 hypothetical protein [Planctomycetota bacterium]MBT4561298.1 hypothetical protein [Planctomycetota bacterium]MBT5101400.1 hypothetical protein [Planctomycetota bacterium]MBT5119283.1 hypothetical protein [Planctomycetota bacterium]